MVLPRKMRKAPVAKFTSIAINHLPVGTILRAPINEMGEANVKLLSEGTEITTALLDKLIARGITRVAISDCDMAHLNAFRPQGIARHPAPPHLYRQSISTNDVSKRIDKIIHSGQLSNLNRPGTPGLKKVEKSSHQPYEQGLEENWSCESEKQISQLSEMFEASRNDAPINVQLLKTHCESILKRICIDQDALVCFAASPFPATYPARHAYHATCLALAMGVECGFDSDNLLQLGMGILLHDVGMELIGLKQFESPTTILAMGLKNLAEHPIAALKITDFPEEEFTDVARLVTYQIHERLDGSGYPRGRMADQIHPLAKIAAVADAFVGMLTPRPHRMGVQGHYALKKILDDTREGKYDPKAVRSLLKTTSLFPLGSYIKLSNGQYGRVIRSNQSEYTKPTIEMVNGANRKSSSTIIDLREEEGVAIAGSLACPKVA